MNRAVGVTNKNPLDVLSCSLTFIYGKPNRENGKGNGVYQSIL